MIAKTKTLVEKGISVKLVKKGESATDDGIKKDYLKNKNICKVTFKLPSIAAPDAKVVTIVGEFNNWNNQAHPMKKLKNGDYTITLELEPGREYQYRYFIDNCKWENDHHADRYVKSPYGDSDNSVVIV